MSKSSYIRFFLLLLTGILATGCSSNGLTDEPLSQQADSDKNLDLLTDYDRDIWIGPDGWTQEQWQWKRRLRWNKECDYLGEVSVFQMSSNKQLIQVECVPGAYQGMQYLYLYNPQDQSAQQLSLDTPGDSSNPYEIWGHLEFNNQNQQLSILSLSRGTGDCGSYRVYSFDNSTNHQQLIEHRIRECSEEALPDNPPESLFDPKQWPLIQ